MSPTKKEIDIKREKLKSSIYTSTFSNKTLLIKSINNLIKKENQNGFFCLSSLESFTKSLDDSCISLFKLNLNSYCNNLFFVKDKHISSLKSLTNDITRLQLSKNKDITIVVPDNILPTTSSSETFLFIKKIGEWAIKNTLTVNLFFYGRESQLIKQVITQNPNLCVGYANYLSVDKNTYLQHVYYWGLTTGMRGESETYHSLNNSITTKYNTELPPSFSSNLDDDDMIYIAKTAIEYGYNIPDTMICVATNDELISHLASVSKAAIVFSCSRQSEVSELGIKVYQLRQLYGQQIKIIIREMKPCLRYADEMYLLKAGTNLILHFGTRFSRMQSGIEMLKGQIFTRPRPSSIEALLSFYTTTMTMKGFVDSHLFVSYVKSALSQLEISHTQCVLIKLDCLPNINISNYLSMCSIKRSGDIMTLTPNSMYLFLQGVRINDLAIALRNIFNLPIQDIFISETTFTSANRIEHELHQMEHKNLAIDNIAAIEHNDNSSSLTAPLQDDLAIHKPLDF